MPEAGPELGVEGDVVSMSIELSGIVRERFADDAPPELSGDNERFPGGTVGPGSGGGGISGLITEGALGVVIVKQV